MPAASRLPTRMLENRLNTDNRMAGSNPQQPLLHEHAIVVIQRHDIRDRAQCDEVEVLCGHLRCAVDALLLQETSYASHQVKSNSHSRQVTAGKPASVQVRVKDYCGVR